MVKLKAKTVFISAVAIAGLTVLSVYLTGLDFHRSIGMNFLLSLGFIAFAFFLFLTYGLYHGIHLVDDYPKWEKYQPGAIFSGTELPGSNLEAGDGLGGLLISILLWVGVTLLAVLFLLLFEAIIWLSLFLIFAILYWVFYRAVKMALQKSARTRGNIHQSAFVASCYTLLYTGWLFAIAVMVQYLR